MDTVWPNINTTFQTAVLPPVEEQEQAAEVALLPLVLETF